jgi:signal transduction histidine kinase
MRTERFGRRLLDLLIAGALSVAAGSSARGLPVAAPDSPAIPAGRKSVLLMNVEQPNLPWVAGVSAGVFAAFEDQPPSHRPDVRTDYLESYRAPERAGAEAAWFRERYRGHRFDAVIAVTTASLKFITPLRDELWPEAPIVLLTPQRSLDHEPLPAGVVSLAARFEVERTLDLVKTILPSTRHLAYVAEDGDLRERWTRDCASRGMEYIGLTGLRLEELERRIATLPPDSAVYFESFHADGTGRRFVPRDVLARVAPLSNSPIFGVSATMVGYGLTGGWVLDFRDLGKEVGRLTLRLLEGQSVSRVPSPSTFSRLQLDDRQLQRWKIPSARVPDGAEILYRRPSLWNDHPGAVAGVVVALALQLALIAALLGERRRVSEARNLTRLQEAEITHMNRVAAMGELASSLAHELNQPLAAIMTNAQAAQRLLTRPSPDLDEVRASLGDIVEDDQRAGDVIHRLRSLVRKEPAGTAAIDVNDVVRKAHRLVSTDASLRNAELTMELAPELPPVQGDGIQLQQVVLNLLVNGLDAVAERPPEQRHVQVRTQAAGGRVAIHVADSGRGVPEADLGRIFDPFFTTKAHGLGMGLAICKSIVEAHSGELSARRAAGGGAEFRCVLPAAEPGPA